MGKNNLYDKELDTYYYKEMKIGNTRILVVDPEITEEENRRRMDHLSDVISSITGYEVQVKRKTD